MNSNVTVATIVRQFDGAALLRALEAATARLEAGADEVNALNVYPVPDGDTGTNMLHTMRAAVKHAKDAEPTIDKVSAAAAYGALMGARGNSGVILSQVIRGLKEAFAGTESAGVAEVRRAAELARKYAFEAVSAPAPGTILSLTASFEKSAAAEADDVVDMFRRIATDAQSAVKRTRDENPTNRAAGVVDAGARGLQLILEGVLSSFTGKELPLDRMAPAARPPGSSLVTTCCSQAKLALRTGGSPNSHACSPRRAMRRLNGGFARILLNRSPGNRSSWSAFAGVPRSASTSCSAKFIVLVNHDHSCGVWP